MDEDAVQVVDLGLLGIGVVHVWTQVDREGELVAVVDLDVGVAHKVVLETLELEVEDLRELFENDALLGVLFIYYFFLAWVNYRCQLSNLETVTGGLVLVVAVHHFYFYVVFE